MADTAIEDMATEIETEDTAAVTTAGRDNMRAMAMMILANGGTSFTATSGLLGGSPPLQHFQHHFFPL